MQDDLAIETSWKDMTLAVHRAFRAAHLITASVPQAEKAVLNALDRFAPDRDSQRTFLRYAIGAAIRQPASESPSNDSYDAVELRSVLALPDLLRRCFVLRFLIGFSPLACARLLHLNVAAVNDYSCAAVHRLAELDPTVYIVKRAEQHS
jgi:hypothetical protein